jgi:hypothetical protein
VLVKSDNMAVVAVLKSGACQDQSLMHLMRCLHFFAAFYQLQVTAAHVPGKDNVAADALSRNDYTRFSSVVPQCRCPPSPIPPALRDMLLLSRPDWTSPSWRRMFKDSLNKV